MGLDLIAFSHARRVACPGGDVCPENHCRVASFRRGGDIVKAGCYVKGRGGRRFDYRVGSYFLYNIWRRHLSLFALGVEPEEVWKNPRRFRGKPFVELIDFPDGGGLVLGPKTAAKLLGDFLALAPPAGEYYSQRKRGLARPPPAWLRRRPTDRRWFNQISMLLELQVVKSVGGRVATGPLDDLRWMKDIYINFGQALDTASEDGFLVLS